MLYVWYNYLQNWVIYWVNVGKYTIHGVSGTHHQRVNVFSTLRVKLWRWKISNLLRGCRTSLAEITIDDLWLMVSTPLKNIQLG